MKMRLLLRTSRALSFVTSSLASASHQDAVPFMKYFPELAVSELSQSFLGRYEVIVKVF